MSDSSVTSTSIRQLPAYMQDYDEALLAQIFGTPDADGVLQGGIMDAEAYPDLFKVPDYVQAGEDPLQTAVYNTFDTDEERQAFMDRANPYFMDAEGKARYLPDAADAFDTGETTIADALTDYFPDAKTYLEAGRGEVGAKNIYDTELKDAQTKADQGTQAFDAKGRADTLYGDAITSIEGGRDVFGVDKTAYDTARSGITGAQGTYGVDEAALRKGTGTYGVDQGLFKEGQQMMRGAQGEYGLSGGLGDARDALNKAGEGEFGARESFDRGTGRAFELAEQGLGKFDPASATQGFMDPYKSQVVDAAMQKITREGAKQRQADSARAIGAGAFGGSRSGVQAAETQRAIEETKQNTVANLMSQGYDKALSSAMSTDEAARKRALQASGLTGELGARGTTIEQQAYEDAAKRGLAAASTSAGLSQTEEQLRAKAFEDARSRGLTGAQLSNAVAETMNKLGMSAYESGATRTMNSEQMINSAKMKAYEDGKARGLTGAQLETSVAQAVENARQSAFESGEKRQQTAGSALGGIAGSQLGAESSSFEGAESRMLKAADMYRSMGLSSAEAQARASEDEKKRDLEAGRLTGGLGSTVGQMGGAQADIGKGYGALAGTSADIGKTYAGMAPADLSYMYGIGGKSREYDQQYNDYTRQNQLNYTQEVLAPYSYAQNYLTGAPSASMYGAYTQTPSQAPNPFLQGVGMYATYQGAQ